MIYTIEESTAKNIANQVRRLTGTTDEMSTNEMAIKLEGVIIGGGSDGSSENDDIARLINGTLTEISNNKVDVVKNYMFYSCKNLTTADFPACNTINLDAFYHCTSLTSINFPACISIGVRAFSSCQSLTSVSFPACTTIGSSVFYSCKKLTTADFPACTTIGDCAFTKCTNLTNINFPACISIGQQAFSSCYKLTSVSFPACTTIGSSAFTKCTSLTTIVLANSSVVNLFNNVFTTTPMRISTYTGSYGSIYVPASLVDSYKTASNWSVYSDRITSIENLA